MKILFTFTQIVEKQMKELIEMVKTTQASQGKGELQLKDLKDLVYFM